MALSPWVQPDTINAHPYNHYALLRSVEDIFGLDPLGYAKRSTGFGADVYNAAAGCMEKPLPKGSGALPKGTLIKHRSSSGGGGTTTTGGGGWG